MLYKWFVICVFLSLSSCDESTVDHQAVQIWTDQKATDGNEASLIIDGIAVGSVHTYSQSPDCEDSFLIMYTLPIKDTISISVRDDEQLLRVVDLYLPTSSSGISVKLYGDSFVDIDGLSKDGCTLMYISW